MHYREAAQVIIGEATRLNEEGGLSNADRRMFEENLKRACRILSDAEKHASRADGDATAGQSTAVKSGD